MSQFEFNLDFAAHSSSEFLKHFHQPLPCLPHAAQVIPQLDRPFAPPAYHYAAQSNFPDCSEVDEAAVTTRKSKHCVIEVISSHVHQDFEGSTNCRPLAGGPFSYAHSSTNSPWLPLFCRARMRRPPSARSPPVPKEELRTRGSKSTLPAQSCGARGFYATPHSGIHCTRNLSIHSRMRLRISGNSSCLQSKSSMRQSSRLPYC